ncbi:uncharacterized protein VDAG_09831 [Verticillium dahliae VdLs.17]|uniref:Uncharacterized protein n=1 Tax=Verticillium dahliae (strain VdLs.17 / ATCC MYA-4575 / FGSC 10137) TaxID=498257 RepID=G2XHE5_VERDV|nr:uncharacterized protein VDAG_09831 [Verticillium dahliae VdLs.17]EGY19371.1 hypothetical protein VDAG_09831 [Verticillium dahliae VdLs.17]
MTDHHIEDFPTRAVQKLTAILTLPPQHGLVRPTAGWQASQSEAVANLPQSCRRPPVEGANPIKLLKRGLMKMSEKHSLPFVPDAAVLCQAHKELHPWRMRSLFLLLASECGIRSDRIRRHHGFDGIPPAQDVQDFVYRMTSIAGLWIAPADFEARFGFFWCSFAILRRKRTEKQKNYPTHPLVNGRELHAHRRRPARRTGRRVGAAPPARAGESPDGRGGGAVRAEQRLLDRHGRCGGAAGEVDEEEGLRGRGRVGRSPEPLPPAPASRRRTVSEISEATEGTVFDMFIRHHDEVRPGDSISTVGGSGRRAGGLGGLTRGGS